MTGSRSEEWQRVRRLEDAQGLLALVLDRVGAIEVQAWEESSWERVWVEAVRAKRELKRLHAILSARWGELMEEAQSDGDK